MADSSLAARWQANEEGVWKAVCLGPRQDAMVESMRAMGQAAWRENCNLRDFSRLPLDLSANPKQLSIMGSAKQVGLWFREFGSIVEGEVG